MPAQYRHCIAMFADDMAAGADTLEELFEIYKALVTALCLEKKIQHPKCTKKM